jgi:F-type H+-transporting ATPase subunit b
MSKFKCLIYLCSFSLLQAGGSEGSWINDWLMPNTGLTLWSIVTFLVLLTLLRWKAWGPLMDALDARAEQIEDSLNKAEKVSAQAEKQALKNEEILNAARQESQQILSQAREAGDKLKSKLEEDGKKEYDNLLEKAKEQIEREKNRAISDLKDHVSSLSLIAAEKIINKSLKDSDHTEIINNTIKEYEQN